jgi:putative transposon-encoded protein
MELTPDGFRTTVAGYDIEVMYFHRLNGPDNDIWPGGMGHLAIVKEEIPIIIVFEYNGKKNDITDNYKVHAEYGDSWIEFPYFALQINRDEECPPGQWENSFEMYLRMNIKRIQREEHEPHEISTTGYEAIEKVVKGQGNSGRVYLPSKWIGHTILCIRIN